MEAPPSLSPSSKAQQLQPARQEDAERSADPSIVKAQEDTVRSFASLLSSDTKTAAKGSRCHGLTSLLSNSVADDAVILTLPALDLQYSDSSDGSSPLPKIGEKKNIHPY